MRTLTAMVLACLMAGCANGSRQPGQGEAFSTVDERNAKDDEICRGYGAQPGTPVYIQCRVSQDQRRDNFRLSR